MSTDVQDLNSMFDSIVDSLGAGETTGTSANEDAIYRNILDIKPGNSYLVRFLPYIENPKNTFFHTFFHTWKSVLTGKTIFITSPKTWDKDAPCPCTNEFFKIRQDGSEHLKKLAEKCLNRQSNYYANVFVIKDPTNPDNDGKVKILRFGSQIHKKIQEALVGEDAKDYGPSAIFSLTETGATFRIKAEHKASDRGNKNDTFVTYENSKFLSKGPITEYEGEINQSEILKSVFDLTKLVRINTEDEIRSLIKVHFYGIAKASNQKTVFDEIGGATKKSIFEESHESKEKEENTNAFSTVDNDDDDLDYNNSVQQENPKELKPTATSGGSLSVDELLDGLDL